MAQVSQRMPAVFIGHGSPYITLADNARTQAWRAFADRVPRPKAVLVISGHWYINATAVTAMAQPRTIHDFFGHSDELFAFQYPAPGDPELARHVADVVSPVWCGLDIDSWGLDHGSWSVMHHFYPDADIPVLQLAINAYLPMEYHLDFGARLAPLRDEGVLIVGSGTIQHNGRSMNAEARANGTFERAVEFDHAVTDVMTTAPSKAASLGDHPDYKLSAPTDDHFLPLLYVAGLAVEAGENAAVLPDGRGPDDDPLVTCYSVGLPAAP